MKNPIKKSVRFVEKNKTYFVAAGVVLLFSLIWYYYKKSQSVTGSSQAFTLKKYRMGQQRYFDPQRVYKMLMVTDTDSWGLRCRLSKSEGIDTVQLVVPLAETFTGSNTYNFSQYIEYANIAADNGLYLVIKPSLSMNGKILGKVFTGDDLMQDRNGNRIAGGVSQLSFSSTKWNEVYNWAKSLSNEFRPFQDAGYILAVFPSTNETQEFIYNLPMAGDFSALETVKSGGLNQMSNLDYLRFQTNQITEKFHSICNEFYGYRMGYDAGSFFLGFHKQAGSFDYEKIANHSSVKFIKNNPRIFDSAEFNSALCYDWKLRKSAYYAAEWTNADGATADTLAERHRVTINQGANLLSFAFHTPDSSGGGQGWELFKQTKIRLQNSGDWDKPVQSPSRVGTLSYSLAEIYGQNGYENGLLSSFNTLRTTNGGTLPNVRCTG